MTKAKSIGLWIATLVLVAIFLMAGSSKVTGGPQMVEEFHRFGYPDWFRVLIGFVEIVGAIVLLFPRTAAPAAVILGGIMVGAAGTHLRIGDGLATLVPLALLALLGLVAYARRPWWLPVLLAFEPSRGTSAGKGTRTF